MSVAGLILSAGESKRMGSPKALLDFRGETFLDRLVRIFSAFCDSIVVVLGAEADRIRAGMKRPEGVLFAENRNYHLGQLSSMQCGLRLVPESSQGVLFTLVDHPNPRPSTIQALLTPPLPLVAIPRYEGQRGHPIFFRRELIPEFLALPPESEAKPVIVRHRPDTRWFDGADPGILDDVDDPAAYRRLLETA